MVGSLTPREAIRQGVHFAVGTLALLLPHLDRAEAAILCSAGIAVNVVVLPRLPWTRRLFRRQERLFGGIVLYPVMVLVLVLVLPGYPVLAAGAWAVLAAGDSASSLVGSAWGGRKLPYNAGKSWSGTGAFFVAGSLWAGFLFWWCEVDPMTGWALAIVALAGIRERLMYSNPPPALRGLGMTFIVVGLMALAFMAFTGITL